MLFLNTAALSNRYHPDYEAAWHALINIALAAVLLLVAYACFTGWVETAVVTPLFGGVDSRAAAYAGDVLEDLTDSYLVVQTLDAAVAVLRSISIDVQFIFGASVSVTQALAPFEKILTYTANTLLFASLAATTVKMLLPVVHAISIALAGTAGLALLAAASALSAFRHRFQRPLFALGVGLLLFTAALRFGVPLSLTVTEQASERFLEDTMQDTHGDLAGTVSKLKPPVTGGASVMKDWANDVTLQDANQHLDSLLGHAVTVVTIHLLKVVIIPLALLWLLAKGLLALFRTTVADERARLRELQALLDSKTAAKP